MPTADKRSFLYFFLPAEPEQGRARSTRESGGCGIVGVEHREIIGPLILEDASLRIHVVGEGLVAVKMVRCDVQDYGNPRPEADDRFQLKAGDFKHSPGIWPRLIREADRGRTDVATDQGRKLAGFNDFARQSGGGRLAVCARDSNDRPGQKLGSEFHFADDRLAQRTRLFELRSVEWHTRADDDQVLSSEGAVAVPAGFDCDPMVEQKQDFVAQLRLGLRVGNGDPRASGLEKQSRGYA